MNTRFSDFASRGPILSPRAQSSASRGSFFKKILISCLLAAAPAATAPAQVTGDWNVNSNGNWSDTSRWVDGIIPNGVGHIADILQPISGTRTVTLDIPVTLGVLRIGDNNNTNSFTLVGQTLTFDNGGAGALLDHTVGNPLGGASKSPSSSDRMDMQVLLNETLTIHADRNIQFYGEWDAQGNDLIVRGNGRTYFVGNSTTSNGRLSNAGTITVESGELRFDGQAGGVTNYVGADLVDVGTGAPFSADRAFTRFYLVNTETTQDFDMNLNGYSWFINDVGNTDQTFTGNIKLTGDAGTNFMDVNDAGTPEIHTFTGVISGTGGFTKLNTGAMWLSNNNTFEGEMRIERGRSSNLGSVHLAGANGAVSNTSAIKLSRDATLYLDNSGSVNNNRVNDSASLTLRDYSHLRIVGNGSTATSETFGALINEQGTNRISFDLNDSTPQGMTVNFASLQRNAGSALQFHVLDNVPGSLGGDVQIHIADGGASAVQYGAGGANGSTNQSLVVGVFGGVADIPDHFMTFDKNDPTLLRPLDFNTEYLLSENLVQDGVAHTLNRDTLNGTGHNVMINYDIERAVNPDPAVDWYGPRPIQVTESIAVNSLRFGTNTTSDGLNTNELGSTLVLRHGTTIYLGDKAAGDGLPEITTGGSGMLMFGRDAAGTAPGSNQYIIGGALDFGSREALLINESGNSSLIRSEIRGSGGLTKLGASAIYLDNANTYTGTTTVAEGTMVVRHNQGLGGSTRADVVGTGALYLELGTTISGVDLYIDGLAGSRTVMRSNGGNNDWNGNIIVDNVSESGQLIYTPYINVSTNDTLNLNGLIYGGTFGTPPAQDINIQDARIISTESSSAGIININGTFQDNINGAGAPVTSLTENDLLRFQVTGNNELVVNVRNQWNAAGRIYHEQGYLRYEGEGNFWSDAAAASMVATNGQSGMRIGGGSSGDVADINLVLTKDGQKLNVDRIDFGGNGSSDNYNNFGNIVLAGSHETGTVTFGNGKSILYYGSTDAARSYTRDLAAYATGEGIVNLDFRLDDGDGDVHTSFTKIGSGTVNLRGDNTTSAGDVEQLNLAGGLLRLTNYATSTGSRFDNGAMLVFAGGSLEMDGVGSTSDKTENFTGTAVGGAVTFPASSAQTIVGPGSSNVIVTSETGRTTTLNIGSSGITLNRQSGGTLNFVENGNGGTSVITLNGAGAPAADTAIAWATYGDTFDSATRTANALDFAMVDASGQVTAFTGASRQDEDNAATWNAGADVSESTAGFSGTTGAGASVNTLHFDFDGASSLTLDSGGLTVESGGIMISSGVIGAGSTKTIAGGALRAGSGQDLIIHQYGAGSMTIASDIVENGGTALVKTGSGELILTGTNTYTGGTYLNGGTLTIGGDAQLGAVPGAVTDSHLRFNGGTLSTTADMELAANRGIMIGGNGAGLAVADGTTLTYGGNISAEPNLTAGYNTPQATGAFVKSGTGTLVLTATTHNTFSGLFDIREGTVVWAGSGLASTTLDLFGSHKEFMDGTILRSGATLEFAADTAATNSNSTTTLNEWMRLEAGSTIITSLLSDSTTPRDRNYTLNGVIHLDAKGQTGGAGAVTFNIGRRGINFNNDGGYLMGDGNIQKIGNGALYFREHNPDWTGQLIINEGAVHAYSAGAALGVGTQPILLGHDGSAVGENGGANNVAGLYVRNESGYNNLPTVTHDIIVRAENGLGSQTKRIGAYYLVHEDVVRFDGNITLNDDVQLYYQDDARDSSITNNSSQVRNDTRSYGAPDNSETIFMQFNGDISGSGNILTYVNQGGNANSANGSITGAMDDMAVYTIFELNGDNRNWTGDLYLSNNAGSTTAGDDVDRMAYVRLGNEFALNDNTVRFGNRGHLQVAGIDKTFSQNFLFIGAPGQQTTAKIQNADEDDVTLTFYADSSKNGPVYQDIGVGMEDGVVYGGRYEDRGILNVVKTGVGHTVFGASTGGGEVADSFSSYSGTTTVQEGILYAGSNNAFSPYSRFIVADGAELSLYWDEASTGFDNTIGSLSGGAAATVDIDNSILRIGGDGSTGADFAGQISGIGNLFKLGTGSQRLSGENSYVSSDVAVIEGTLIGGSNTAFGDLYNVIRLGGAPLVSVNPIDARVELLLDGTATAVDNMVSMNSFDGNDEGITIIGTRATSGTYGFTSNSMLEIARNFFTRADGESTFQLGGALNDYGYGTTLTKIGSGTVELHGENYYGPFAFSDVAIDGGTVLRQGTLSVFNELALASTVIELGDRRQQLSQGVYLATNSSLLVRGGEFDSASGAGSFVDVSSEVDGVSLTAADVGKRILVKNELGNAEQNGVYQVVSVNEAEGTMVLARAGDFDESSEMLYGSSVSVESGSQAGQSWFMASADVDTVNGDGDSPVYWEQEDASADLALVAGVDGLTILNEVDVNDTNGGGRSAIGGIFTSGNATFSGNITLQHQNGMDNIHEVTLTSASDTDTGTGERGTLFTGILSEAQLGDTLHVRIDGGGTVTLTSDAHSYTGKTTVGEDSTLLLYGNATVANSPWLEVESGGVFDTTQFTGGSYTLESVVSGSGTLEAGAGGQILIEGSGHLRPGLSSSQHVIATAGDGVGTLTVNGDLTLSGGGADRLTLNLGVSGGADYNDAANFGANSGAGFNSWLLTQGDAYDAYTGGNHDRLVVNGDLGLEAGGYIRVENSGGSAYQPQYGDVFNLLDWTSLSDSGFNEGGTTRGGGLIGDLYLPSLPGHWFYNTSLFGSHGIIVVVPEPGRAGLLAAASVLLLLRRRRPAPQRR